jgi:hypothetical protein
MQGEVMEVLNWMGEHPILTFFLVGMTLQAIVYLVRGGK